MKPTESIRNHWFVLGGVLRHRRHTISHFHTRSEASSNDTRDKTYCIPLKCYDESSFGWPRIKACRRFLRIAQNPVKERGI